MKHLIRTLCLTILLLTNSVDAASKTESLGKQTEILWDTWGVPHIYAPNTEKLFYAFGWAQMHSHGNYLLKNYGTKRGRAAEYWGKKYLNLDKHIRRFDAHGVAQRWYEAQDADFRLNLDAFARGINDYAAKYPDRIDENLKQVLPVTGIDPLNMTRHGLLVSWIGKSTKRSIQEWKKNEGSNAWAVAPSRSASGNALLLANPHIKWENYYEAHLNAPGLNLYGATPVGFPSLFIAFNSNLGWTVTRNLFDGRDDYELTLTDDGYKWNDGVRPFKTAQETILVKQDDGTMKKVPFEIRHSVHGPVIAQRGRKALASKVVGFDRPHILRQMWDMGKSSNLKEFQSAMQQLQFPMFNIIYADTAGHIFFMHNGLVAKRPFGNPSHWQGIVKGDSDATFWDSYYSYEDLPKALDPSTGWIQNANDGPWTCTYPAVLDPKDYSEGICGYWFGLRAARSTRLIMGDDHITFDEFIKYKHDTRIELADILVDELISAAHTHGGSLAKEAAAVLDAWDRCADNDSRGTELFRAWAAALPRKKFAIPFDRKHPLKTPKGLWDTVAAVEILEHVAIETKRKHGALDVAWGDVLRLRVGDYDLPGNGVTQTLGVFRVTDGPEQKNGKRYASGGDSYVAVIEFSNPPKARSLLSWGNATQPGSKHIGDQLKLYSRKELKPVLRLRSEVEANVEMREVLK